MDTSSEQYFDWVCRTCMREVAETTIPKDKTVHIDQPEQQWQSIFDRAEECGSTLSIAELLSNTTPQIEVSQGDDLPKKICHVCLQQLTSVHRFQQMCIQSDQQMREMIATIYADLDKAEDQESTGAFVIQELHSESIVKKHGVKTMGTLPIGQQQTGVGDLFQSLGENWEELSNWVKNEPCDDNDEYLAKDDDREIVHLTIDIKEENVVPPAKPKSRYFQKPESLQRHHLSHENKADTVTHSCELCEKRFSTRGFLYMHIENVHFGANIGKLAEKEYTCEICRKAFKFPSGLRSHQRTHTGERPYMCTECGKSFASAGCLRQHHLRHSNKKSFECPYCPKRFNCTADVIKHKIRHEGIKPHICDICGKGFCKPYQLTKHKGHHSGEKPYKCEYCEMRFYRLNSRRVHTRTHTGEKPYKCKYCERAFTQSGDLIKHLRTHLGDNVYGCSLCPAGFRLASQLRVHFTTHKNENEETREGNMKALKDKEAKLQLKFFKNETQQPLVEDV